MHDLQIESATMQERKQLCYKKSQRPVEKENNCFLLKIIILYYIITLGKKSKEEIKEKEQNR
jgi:hypothetical protein